MRVLIAALAAACLSAPAFAKSSDEYRIEGVLGFTAGKSGEQDGNSTVTDTTVDLTYNFSNISTFDIPYSEASFLNRPSFINFRQSTISIGERADGLAVDFPTQTEREFSGRYVFTSGFFAEYFVGAKMRTLTQINLTGYEVQVGKFLDEFSNAYLGYIFEDSNEDLDLDLEGSPKIFTLGMHFASPYGATTGWISYDFGGKYSAAEGNNGYAAFAGVAYYPVNHIGLGGFFEYTQITEQESSRSKLYGEYYFSPKFSVRVEANNDKEGDAQFRTVGGSVKLRY